MLFLFELGLTNVALCEFPPSLRCAGALYTIRVILSQTCNCGCGSSCEHLYMDMWTQELSNLTHYDCPDLQGPYSIYFDELKKVQGADDTLFMTVFEVPENYVRQICPSDAYLVSIGLGFHISNAFLF